MRSLAPRQNPRSVKQKSVHHLRLAPCLAAAAALTLAANAQGAVETWVGNASINWNATNWAGANPIPLDFDSLVFGAAGSAGAVLNNDLVAETLIGGITFDVGASAYTLNGNAITLAGPVLNSSTSLQTINLPLSLLGQQIFTTSADGGNITLGGIISGSSTDGVTKAGAGTLTLSNPANTYKGETIFGVGIINVASLSNYGVASSLGARDESFENNTLTGIGLHFRGGTLQYTGTTPQSTNRQIRILNGNGATLDASGSLPEATLSFTHSGPNINLFDTGGARTLTLTGTNTGKNSFSIQLTNQAANQTHLNKTGAGTWFIANSDNTYTGETIIAGGILNVASVSDYGVPSSIGARPFDQENNTVTGVGLHFMGGTLQYTGSTPQSTNRHIRMLIGNGATIDASGATPEATLSFTRTGANQNLFDTGGARTLTLTGSNTGNNSFSIQLANQSTNLTSLTKSGAGTWVINGPDTNTATGATTVTGGTLVLAKTGATAVSGSLTVGNFFGPAVVVLGGTGGNQIANTSIVSLNGSGSEAGVLRMNNNTETIAALRGDGIVENESGSAGTGVLTVNVGVGGSEFFAGVLRDGDGIGTDGKLALVKAGGGALNFNGTSTHTGATTVSAGTLTVDGALGAGTTMTITNALVNGFGTIAGPVSVLNGGTLSSDGIVSGAVTLSVGATLGGTGNITGGVTAGSGSRIVPGTSTTPGTLTMSSLNLASGSTIDFELDGTSDRVVISSAGGLTLGGGAVNLFDFGGASPLTKNGSYTLIDYNTSYVGLLADLSVANSQIGKFYTLTDDKTNTVITLTVADSTLSEWNGGAGTGQWTTAGNWTGGTPNGAGAVAKFGAIPTSPTAVAVSGAKTVGGILFDNANSYTVSGGSGDTVTLSNGVAAASITVASGNHTLAAPLVLASSVNSSTALDTTLTISGNISGDRSFIASGAGKTILTGTNTYARTTVGGGILQVGNNGTSGTLGSGDVSVETGGGLVFHRSDNITIPNSISGAGAQVTKLGAGTLTLTGTNTFATANGSGFNINEGTVKLGNANALVPGVVLGFNGGTLDLNGNNLTTGFLTGGSGNITDEGAAAGTSTLTVDQTGTTTYGGSINNGAGRSLAVTKTGTGSLTLAGSNNFTGPLTITGGSIIAAGEGGKIPIVSDVILGDGSDHVILTAGAAGQQFGAGTVLNFNNGGRNAKFQLRGSNQTVAGLDSTPNPSVSLSIIQNDEIGTPGYLDVPGPATLTIDTAGEHVFAGLIRNQAGGGLHLVKKGAGTQEIRNILVGPSSFTSATVNEGKLTFNLMPNAGNTHTLGAGTSLVSNPGGTLALDGTWTVPATVIISGDGEIIKQGDGSVRIDSVNTFTRGLVINSGTIEIGNNEAFGIPSAPITINGGGLRAAGAARQVANPVLVNNDFTLGRLTDLNGGLTLTKDVTITANNFDGAANNPSSLSAISGNFRVAFAQGPQGIGTGALVISGQNTNSGGTTITSGRVNVAATGALANADLAVNGGELNLNNAAQTITGLSGSGGRINLDFSHTLTINQNQASTFAGVIGGGGSLVKDGAGALTLSGMSPDYFGPVSVRGGSLLVAGSISGEVTVSGASSVLGGFGATGPVTVQNGGTLNPGGGIPGTLTTAGLTMTSGTKLSLEINSAALGAGYDQLNVSGPVDLGASTLSLLGSFLMALGGPNDLFYVLLNDGIDPITGTFNGIPEGGFVQSSSGQNFMLTYQADFGANTFAGGNDIALMAIPEPGSALSLFGGMAMLLGLRRRRA